MGGSTSGGSYAGYGSYYGRTASGGVGASVAGARTFGAATGDKDGLQRVLDMSPTASATRRIKAISESRAAIGPDCEGSAFLLQGCGPTIAANPTTEMCENMGGLLPGCGQARPPVLQASPPSSSPVASPAFLEAKIVREACAEATEGFISSEAFAGALVGSIVASALITALLMWKFFSGGAAAGTMGVTTVSKGGLSPSGPSPPKKGTSMTFESDASSADDKA